MGKLTLKDLREWKKNPSRREFIAINTSDF